MEPQVKQKVAAFFASYKQEDFKKGELFIRAGENPSGIFYLERGVVRQYIISQKGEEVVLNIYKEGAFFPMSWVVDDIRNNYYYEAMTDIAVKKASKQEVRDFIQKEPDVVLDLLRRIYKGMEGVLMHLEHLMSGDAHIKLLASLIIFAKRFGRPVKEGLYIDLEMTERDLASYSGIARETVSRELAKLMDAGMLTFADHHLTIKDVDALTAEFEAAA